MVVETKVYQKNQTTIPTVYTKNYNVEPEDIVEWRENEDGKLYLTFGFVEIPLIKKTMSSG